MSYLQRLNTFVQEKLSTRVNDRIAKVEEILNSMALDYTSLDAARIFNGQTVRRAIVASNCRLDEGSAIRVSITARRPMRQSSVRGTAQTPRISTTCWV